MVLDPVADDIGMTIDPDGKTFWYLGEYSKVLAPGPAANWGTHISSFSIDSCVNIFADAFESETTSAW